MAIEKNLYYAILIYIYRSHFGSSHLSSALPAKHPPRHGQPQGPREAAAARGRGTQSNVWSPRRAARPLDRRAAREKGPAGGGPGPDRTTAGPRPT